MSIEFNPNQLKVIDHRGKPLLIIAGPGTGKTTTLVERISRILESEPEAEISFVTFTRTSRRDAEKRIDEVLSRKKAKTISQFPSVATLYMFAKALLHRYATLINMDSNFKVISPGREDEILISEVIQDLSLVISIKELKERIYAIKCTGDQNVELEEAFKYYEKLMMIYNAIDIPNMVYKSVDLLKKNKIDFPKIFLHIDEYQDLNRMDQELINEVIKSGDHEVVVCGDDEQSIYGLRYANPEGIKAIYDNREWENIAFSKCNRLPPHILRASRKLIEAHRGPHINKQMDVPGETSDKIITFQCTKPNIEARFIAKHIKAIMASNKKRNGATIEYKDIMVLCPTNAVVDEFYGILNENGIDVKKKKQQKIPDNIWKILLFLRISAGDDGLAFRQLLNILGISKEKIDKLRNDSLKNNEKFIDCAKHSSDEDIAKSIALTNALQSNSNDLNKLVEILKKEYEHYANYDEIIPFIEKYSISSTTKLIGVIYSEYGIIDREDEATEDNKVFVTTLHSSKGLEAEVVYIVRVNQNIIPLHNRDWDEELRSFYVGITRAKQCLFFSFYEIFDAKLGRNLREESMSPFLKIIKEFIRLDKKAVADLR